MNTSLRKALSDLRGERGRSVSIVIALALGIAAFSAVLSTYGILTRALNEGYLATAPASATLVVNRADPNAVLLARAVPGVESAEPRRTIRGRIKSGPVQWRNLVLFVREDFQTSRVGMIQRQAGTWPHGPNEIAIERDALKVANAKVGDRVTIRSTVGKERTLNVTSSVHDVGQAQARMENMVYGYATRDVLEALGEAPYYDELAIRVADRALDQVGIRKVADTVARRLNESGRRVTRVDVPEPGQHPHAKIMGLLFLSIAVFGFFIVALSGTIVFNVLTALLAGQKRQIGVMKAIGGSRFQIARIYLLEAALFGLAAIVVGFPLGVAGGRALSLWMAGFLNFDIATYELPLWIYGFVLIVGLGIPLMAAALPVWLGTRVPVREALTDGAGAGRVYGTSVVDRALASIGGPSRTLLLALRNATRHRLRVGLTLVTLTSAGVFFMSALNLKESMVETVDRVFERRPADISVTLAEDYPLDSVEQVARGIAGVAAAEGWIVVPEHGRNVERLHPDPNELSVVGLPPNSTLFGLEVTMGRRLDGAGGDAVVVNPELFRRLGEPALGEAVQLRFGGEQGTFRLVGVVREPFAPPTAYVHRQFFDARRNTRGANTLRIALANPAPATVDAVKSAVDANLERAGFRASQSTTKAEGRYAFDAHMLMIYVFLIVVACILGGVGALGLLTTVSLNVTERRRELGVLRAIGATPGRIARLVVIEGVIVGALAWLVATATAWPLSKIIGDALLTAMFKTTADIPRSVEPTGIAAWFLMCLVGSALASLRPALLASRIPVREALAYE